MARVDKGRVGGAPSVRYRVKPDLAPDPRLTRIVQSIRQADKVRRDEIARKRDLLKVPAERIRLVRRIDLSGPDQRKRWVPKPQGGVGGLGGKGGLPPAPRRALSDERAFGGGVLHRLDSLVRDIPTCKERPKDNVRKSGGGAARRFIPWCDRRS